MALLRDDHIVRVRRYFEMPAVVIGERVLIDGGGTNPLPFDLLRGQAHVTVAVDITGQPAEDRKDVPSAVETLYAA